MSPELMEELKKLKTLLGQVTEPMVILSSSKVTAASFFLLDGYQELQYTLSQPKSARFDRLMQGAIRYFNLADRVPENDTSNPILLEFVRLSVKTFKEIEPSKLVGKDVEDSIGELAEKLSHILVS